MGQPLVLLGRACKQLGMILALIAGAFLGPMSRTKKSCLMVLLGRVLDRSGMIVELFLTSWSRTCFVGDLAIVLGVLLVSRMVGEINTILDLLFQIGFREVSERPAPKKQGPFPT